MNRHQWKAQHYGSHVNYLHLTWSEDQRRKHEQERRAAMRQMGLFVFCLVLVAVIVWGIA